MVTLHTILNCKSRKSKNKPYSLFPLRNNENIRNEWIEIISDINNKPAL